MAISSCNGFFNADLLWLTRGVEEKVTRSRVICLIPTHPAAYLDVLQVGTHT